MSNPTTPPASRPSPGILAVVMLLLFGSGCAALIYEVVWFQLLELVIGASGVSIGILLATYMGGMCLGSLLLPKVIASDRHPLRVYAALELGIGLIGILVLLGLPLVGRLYSNFVGHGMAGTLLRGVVASVCLLPPTILMGATLPAVSRWLRTTPRGVSWLGIFYGGNTLGAVFGCLLAGFYLLRVHDTVTATYTAVAINGLIAVASWVLATVSSHHPDQVEVELGLTNPSPSAGLFYWVIGLSGLTALGAEVVWTRQLSLLFGGSVYTFSIILAVFLVGLGLGSTAGSYLARWSERPAVLLGTCQLLLVAAFAWSAIMIAKMLPNWPIDPSMSLSPWYTFEVDLVRCIAATLPGALLWGASFPFALAAISERGPDAGRLMGSVYASNTVGSIAGAILASLILIPSIGTQQTQRIFGVGAGVAALLTFGAIYWQTHTGSQVGVTNRSCAPTLKMGLSLVLLGGLAGVLISSIPAIPWQLVAFGRYAPKWHGNEGASLYVGEGMNASVAVTELGPDRALNFHVSGKVEASTLPRDMRLQRMLGHFSALLHPNPRSVLVVGCGAGVTAGSFTLYPGIERIVICEIEPLIPEVVAQYFARENYNVLDDDRVEVVYDDARNFILTTDEKFDVITSDPIHPWVKGSATLYTKEYFEKLRERLNPNGVVTQWVPLYESTEDVVKSELATFFEVFPGAIVWSNDDSGRGYDTVLSGMLQPVPFDVDALSERLARDDYRAVAESLDEVGLGTALRILLTYAGREPDLRPWLRDAQINLDRNLRLQYLAGMGIYAQQDDAIYASMLDYRAYPDDWLTGSDFELRTLKTVIETFHEFR